LLPFAVCLVAACGHRADLTRSSTQENFGVQMARINLWREAMFRFKRAVEISPGDAMAHNNLAVAYEANGDFENARKEYLEALRLDRSNQFIQKNYSRYVEFLSRNRKRQTKDVKVAGAPANTPEAGSTAAPATQPQPVPPPAPQPPPQPPPNPPSP
jgi:Tfp pilus assembly protein PilF